MVYRWCLGNGMVEWFWVVFFAGREILFGLFEGEEDVCGDNCGLVVI